MTLTSHASAMDLVIEFPGNGVVPRQRFSPIPQFFMRAATEKGAQTVTFQRRVPQHLQGFEQHGNWHRVQHNRR